jgi:sodium pump decarboxylase gamma subunit
MFLLTKPKRYGSISMLMLGLNLTIIGMVIVFIFLTLLVLLLIVISRFVRAGDEKQMRKVSAEGGVGAPSPQTGEAQSEGPGTEEGEKEIAAAIASAIAYKRLREQE